MTRQRHTPRAFVLVLVAVLLAGAACSKDEQVGGQDNLAFEEQDSGRVGEITAPSTTSTTAAPVTTVKPAAQQTTTTTAPRATTTTTAAPGVVIKIVSGGQGFDPFNFKVRAGTRLTVRNTDSQSRTFTSDQPGAFDSGPLAPGAEWSFVPTQPGKFNFHDETRPFAVGQMEVTG